MLFDDRHDAGRQLAAKLASYANRDDVVVLALPRGGVPVGYEVAAALQAPLDVFVVRKLGVPGQEELALGAIASGGIRVLNEEVIEALNITDEEIEQVTRTQQGELVRREQEYRGGRAPLEVRGRTVILVDDGLATGSSMRAASLALASLAPRGIIVAVPVAASTTCEELRAELPVDNIICVATPEPFFAVGQWYRHFEQTSDEEVRQLLETAVVREARYGGTSSLGY